MNENHSSVISFSLSEIKLKTPTVATDIRPMIMAAIIFLIMDFSLRCQYASE